MLARDPSGLRTFSVSTRVLESSNSNWLPSLRLTLTRLFGPVVSLSPTRRAVPWTAGIDFPALSTVTVPLSALIELADICAHARGASVNRIRSKAAVGYDLHNHLRHL